MKKFISWYYSVLFSIVLYSGGIYCCSLRRCFFSIRGEHWNTFRYYSLWKRCIEGRVCLWHLMWLHPPPPHRVHTGCTQGACEIWWGVRTTGMKRTEKAKWVRRWGRSWNETSSVSPININNHYTTYHAAINTHTHTYVYGEQMKYNSAP